MKTTANNRLFKSFDWRWNGTEFEGEFTIDADPDLIDLLEQHLVSRWLFDLGGMVGKVVLVEMHVTNPLVSVPGFGMVNQTYTTGPREARVRFVRAGDPPS